MGASPVQFVTGLQQLFLRLTLSRCGNNTRLVPFDCTLQTERNNLFAVAWSKPYVCPDVCPGKVVVPAGGVWNEMSCPRPSNSKPVSGVRFCLILFHALISCMGSICHQRHRFCNQLPSTLLAISSQDRSEMQDHSFSSWHGCLVRRVFKLVEINITQKGGCLFICTWAEMVRMGCRCGRFCYALAVLIQSDCRL